MTELDTVWITLNIIHTTIFLLLGDRKFHRKWEMDGIEESQKMKYKKRKL